LGLDAAAIAEAVARLIEAPLELSTLATSARSRRFPTWPDYAGDLTRWMGTLRRRI
jgi:hypothetical protein